MSAAPQPVRPGLTPEGVERIRKALARVLDDPHGFSPFLYDFAWSNHDRVVRYGTGTFWTRAQWGIVEQIEERIRRHDEADAIDSVS